MSADLLVGVHGGRAGSNVVTMLGKRSYRSVAREDLPIKRLGSARSRAFPSAA